MVASCHRTPISRDRCGTKPRLKRTAREVQKPIEQSLFREDATEPTTTHRIPVYFHVIRKGEDDPHHDGNLTPDEIDQQMDKLNRGFGNTRFQFYLAAKPDYHTNQQWFDLNEESDDEVEEAWGVKGKDVLNIYTANLQGGVEGRTVDPTQISDFPFKGVMILFSTLPGGIHFPDNLGQTLVHEVGHWLGLFHTFNKGCEPPGDWVDDTPPEASRPTRCFPAGQRDSCQDDNLPDPVDNFMDYSDDTCLEKHFTKGQSHRMDDTFATYRQ